MYMHSTRAHTHTYIRQYPKQAFRVKNNMYMEDNYLYMCKYSSARKIEWRKDHHF